MRPARQRIAIQLVGSNIEAAEDLTRVRRDERNLDPLAAQEFGEPERSGALPDRSCTADSEERQGAPLFVALHPRERRVSERNRPRGSRGSP